MAGQDAEAAVKDFHEAVNMTPGQIEKWLETDDSKEVGQKENGKGESTGHQSGRHIIEILHKKKADYSEDDIAHMHKVVGYVKRHLAQRPSGRCRGDALALLADELGPRPREGISSRGES